jgi:putative CocE/NonD family hydrolase
MFEGSHIAYHATVLPDLRIPMRDGIELACDVYLPALEGRAVEGQFPTIVERTPGLKDSTGYSRRGRWYAARGYAVVINDVRGRGRSEGVWYPFAEEAPDGYDTVEWSACQPWSNGCIGTMGGSYSGSSQSALATLGPPHLRAQVVGQGTSNYHTSSMRQGGALELRFVRYAFWMATTSQAAFADPELKRTLEAEFARLPQILGPPLRFRPGRTALRFVPNYEQWLWDVLTHGDFDDYWMQRGYAIDRYWDEYADVPLLLQSGWYDTYPRAAVANFQALRARKRSPTLLLIGPWCHTEPACETSLSGDVEFGVDSPLALYDDVRLRFFDQYLKGLNTGIEGEPPVRYFVMGTHCGRRPANLARHLWRGGEWRTALAWPPAEFKPGALFLQPDGRLLSTPMTTEWEPSSYTYDPRNPVPTIGGSISAAEDVLPSGGFDQRERPGLFFGHSTTLPLGSRPDVLCFESDALEYDLEMVGPMEVVLFASSSAPDTDFTAKLLDVYPHDAATPGGYELNVCDGIIRARYRNGFDHQELLKPGKVYEFRIVLYPTATRFAAGHRIRVDISSSNYPRFDANPNTGEPLGRARRTEIAHQAVFHDALHPSHVSFYAARSAA